MGLSTGKLARGHVYLRGSGTTDYPVDIGMRMHPRARLISPTKQKPIYAKEFGPGTRRPLLPEIPAGGPRTPDMLCLVCYV